MSIGSLEGRVLLAAGLVAAVFVWDVVLLWVREMPWRRHREPVRGEESLGGEVLPAGVAADKAAARQVPDGPAKAPAVDRPAAETEAQKTWQAAREMPHGYIPDWENDADYLTLLHDAAVGGSEEAMDKLSDYAFRRKAFVEAYYWKLKLDMRGGRLHDVRTKAILGAWVDCGCPAQYRNVMRGFSEEQGMFARAVMRIKAGIDVARANRRLKLLAKAGNADAQQYLRSGRKQKAD